MFYSVVAVVAFVCHGQTNRRTRFFFKAEEPPKVYSRFSQTAENHKGKLRTLDIKERFHQKYLIWKETECVLNSQFNK